MLHSNSLAWIAVSTALAAPALAQDKPQPDKPQRSVEERLDALEKVTGGDFLRAYWKDGLRFESADKKYKVKLGGRIHYDGQFFDPDDDTKTAIETGTTRIEDGTELRRARIELSGEVSDRTDWALALDFGGGSTNFRNAYVGVKDLPFGNIRAGQFKEPYGLEQITSSNNITFIERSLMNSLVPAFNAGVMLFDDFAGERATWSIGEFRTASDNGEVSRDDGAWATTARITGLPMYSDDGRDYVHVGVGYSLRSPTDDGVIISAKPEANLAPVYIGSATVPVPAETFSLMGVEAAWVMGPLTVSGEYSIAAVDSPSGVASEPDFAGYYAQVSYFLTGESRGYRKAQGCFDALKPNENAFGEGGGHGAWEVAARISSLDLADDGTDNGELDDLTFGVNWYLNPNTRLMVDYIMADLDPAGAGDEGDTNVLAFRAQFNY